MSEPVFVIHPPSDPVGEPVDEGTMALTVWVDEASPSEVGPMELVIRFRDEVRLRDVAFLGTLTGAHAQVLAILLGETPILTSEEGVSLDHFERPELRDCVLGWRGVPGQELRVKAFARAPGRLVLALVGHKRIQNPQRFIDSTGSTP